MHWWIWWQVLVALQAASVLVAQAITPTMCDEQACHCDSFTRVICNCTSTFDEVTFRPDGAYRVPQLATGIIIDGCTRVQFLSDTIKNLIMLRVVEIRNSDNVVINERGLAWSPFNTDLENNPGIKIVLENSTVNEISSHAIQGRVNNIRLAQSRLKNIKPFAFSSLTGVINVELIDNNFENIEIQAFKKFTTHSFTLRGGTIRTLPSRFLSDVEVANLFRMEGVFVKYVYSLTFFVSSPQRVLVENNIIDTLEGDAFYIATKGPIAFRNNTVRYLRKGAFSGFSVNQEVISIKGIQELLIDNNTITHLSPSSLMYNNATLALRIDGLNVNASCSCELTDEWKDVLKEQGGTINCWYMLENHYMSLPSYVDRRCGTFKQTFWIFVVIGIVVVLLLTTVGVLYIVRRENEKKKKVQIVMPDGKTYRETEFHIVVERAELLTTDL